MQLEKRGGPGSPPRPPPQEGDEVVVETEVVEVEKPLGHCQFSVRTSENLTASERNLKWNFAASLTKSESSFGYSFFLHLPCFAVFVLPCFYTRY